MKKQFIFEIGSEEIPAGYLLPALRSLRENFAAAMLELELPHGEIKGAVTPRRLAISVDDLADRQPDKTEEIIGPPEKAAFDAGGKPTRAALGFVKSRGASLSDIQIVNTARGEYLMIRQERRGRATRELLSSLLPELIKSIYFPKSMRWGAGRTTFARPIQWLMALYDGEVVPCTVDGAGETGALTYGHRFMAPQAIEVKNYEQYIAALREHHVLADPEERKAAVLAEITRAAQGSGGTILPDAELVATVANIVESPHAIRGTFDEKFLELPKDALITSMREHQKYFAIVDDRGRLQADFVAVNNTRLKDAAVGAEGHQRVLRARLEDGLFFFREDQRRKLEERVADLEGIIFQAQLGTMREKTVRVQALAEKIAAIISPELTRIVSRAAWLAKADLITEMVNEFPSLQGIMGRDYALLNGESAETAQAIAEHYMPIRAGSPLPASLAGAVVSMADRLDTLAGCFGIGQRPSGTADPFGLRRQALGLIHIILQRNLSLPLVDCLREALRLYGDKLTVAPAEAQAQALDFIKGRFVNDQIRRGRAAEAVEAVVSVSFADIVDCRYRLEALTAISREDSFALLAGSFKRVMNIIKGHEAAEVNSELFESAAEDDLYHRLQEVSALALPLLQDQKYTEALNVILKMKEPVDVFFDKVMVMTDNPAVRDNRLHLLTAVAELFLRVGDLSKMTVAGDKS
ncbi:glycine--tRNA ligase subunit beta [Desulfobacterota bacterium M19]